MSEIETKIIKIEKNMKLFHLHEDFKKAAEVLRNGGLVAFPTETVYGLGANALNSEAVKKTYEAKGRPGDNPVIVHIGEIKDILILTVMNDELVGKVKLLADRFWPGPLTLVLPKSDRVPDAVTGGLKTVAVRIPDNNVARELIRLSGVPIAAPSANISGRPSPTTAEHVVDDLFGRIDYIIDAGSTDVGVESTVLDMTEKTPAILRPGGVTYEMLKDVLPEITKKYNQKKDEAPKSPGLKYKHYAPEAEMLIVKGGSRETAALMSIIAEKELRNGRKTGIIVSEETADLINHPIVAVTGSKKNPNSAAHSLFDILRNLDDQKVDLILAEAMEESGVGEAVMNRMVRAAGEKIINASFSVLFVCTGNTCRSPMAEYLLKRKLETRSRSLREYSKLISVSSAGIFAYEGQPASAEAYKVMKNDYNMDMSGHSSRTADNKLLMEADIILTMTEGHKNAIVGKLPEVAQKTFTLGEFSRQPGIDIVDPFGGSSDIYRNCASQIDALLDNALDRIIHLAEKKFKILPLL